MMRWQIGQMDVDSAFLYGDLDDEVYTHIPQGYMSRDRQQGKVWKLQKSLYGLRCAPRIWYDVLSKYLQDIGFMRTTSDSCMFTHGTDINDRIITCVYVDDIIFIASSHGKAKWFERKMAERFNMKLLGFPEKLLGMQISKDPEGLHLSQELYITDGLDTFQLQNSQPKSTPMETGLQMSGPDPSDLLDNQRLYQSMVGTLMYSMIGTRPDISYSVGVLSRHMQSAGPVHLAAAKRVFQYLLKTKSEGLKYRECTKSESPYVRKGTVQLCVYTDSDWANNPEDRRSVTGYVCFLGGNPVSWKSKKQPTTTLSSAEAEYVAAAQSCQEITWIRSLLGEIGFEQDQATQLYIDNQAAQKLSQNPVFHGRTKHIDVRHHFIRDMVSQNQVKLSYVPTDKNVADLMTKSLCKTKFLQHCQKLRLEGACWNKQLAAAGHERVAFWALHT
jgi:hypothetical protein